MEKPNKRKLIHTMTVHHCRKFTCGTRIAGAAAFALFASYSTALEWGTLSLNSRVRFETAELTGKEDADNLSLRIRPGITTKEYSGFMAMVEGDFNLVSDKDSYNAAGVHGDSDKAVIADPENAQLDQAWVSYAYEGYNAKAGRQVIALDNQRWIGHVGWRQSRQTYDAVTLQGAPIEGVSMQYSYIANVVRIFGDSAPSDGANASEFGSSSHLLNASWAGGNAGKFTAYGYILDLDDSPGKIAGSDTFGISYAGEWDATEGLPLGVYLEAANQSDAGDNVQDYSALYFHGKLSGSFKGASIEAGYELLGSDDAGLDDEGNETFASVKAPLATLHAFNGFADVFLVTPDKGLQDAYVSAGYKFDLGEDFGPLISKIWYHDFSSDEGSDDLGSEIDVVLAKPIPIKSLPGTLGFIFKYADYDAPTEGNDLTRLTAELNYAVSF